MLNISVEVNPSPLSTSLWLLQLLRKFKLMSTLYRHMSLMRFHSLSLTFSTRINGFFSILYYENWSVPVCGVQRVLFVPCTFHINLSSFFARCCFFFIINNDIDPLNQIGISLPLAYSLCIHSFVFHIYWES